jgi:hypothetical protein
VGFLPLNSTLRIWDIFLNEGCKVLFRVSIALLKKYEKEILKIDDIVELSKFFKSLEENFFDIDGLLSIAYKDYPFPLVKSFPFSSTTSRSSSSSVPNPAHHVENLSTSRLVITPRVTSLSSRRNSIKSNERDKRPRPRPLSGFGVGHLGNIGECLSGRYQPVKDLASLAWDKENHQESSNAYDDMDDLEYQSIHYEANKLTDDLLAQVKYDRYNSNPVFSVILEEVLKEENERQMMKEEDDISKINTDVKRNSTDRKSTTSSENSSFTDVFEEFPVFAALSSSTADAVTDPTVIAKYTEDISSPNSFLEKFNKQLQLEKEKEKKKELIRFPLMIRRRSRKSSNPVIDFKRKDITYWRNIFRPILEERYHKREVYQKAFYQFKEYEKNQKNSKPVTVDLPENVNLEENVAEVV